MSQPVEERRKRIRELANWIHDAPGGRADANRVVGKAGYLWGLKSETVREYVQILDLAGLVRDDGDFFQWVGKE